MHPVPHPGKIKLNHRSLLCAMDLVCGIVKFVMSAEKSQQVIDACTKLVMVDITKCVQLQKKKAQHFVENIFVLYAQLKDTHLKVSSHVMSTRKVGWIAVTLNFWMSRNVFCSL